MNQFAEVQAVLRTQPKQWLVTGAAGFIGSNLVERLLGLGQTVVGLVNLSTGYPRNVEDALAGVAPADRARFRFLEGEIRDIDVCRAACWDVDLVLPQAALGSVPRSVSDPLVTHRSNMEGFLHMLIAARDENVARFVYAASSSTYGDHPALPKVEETIGEPRSPYAVTKIASRLGYQPSQSVADGMREALEWYVGNQTALASI